jgi:nuclease S1
MVLSFVPTRRFKRLAVVLLASAVFLVATRPPAWAWGRMAHRVSARLAESRLTPAARAAVRELLGPGVSLADISTWADEVRRDIPESGPWHYVNVPITEPKYSAKFCPGEAGCVCCKIADFQAVLGNPRGSKEDRARALKFLVHFVQDMHQPVHVGDRSDRGGNDCQVQFFDQGSNLHRVWDSGILEHASTEESVLLAELKTLIAKPDAADWPNGTVDDWANESFQAARSAYTIPGTGAALKKGAKLGQDYQDANLPVARKRVAQSAVRLAAVLNAALTPRTD